MRMTLDFDKLIKLIHIRMLFRCYIFFTKTSNIIFYIHISKTIYTMYVYISENYYVINLY